MVGVIPALLCDFIRERWGEAALRSIKESAGVPPEKSYRLDSVYADEEWRRLFEETARLGKDDKDEVERDFAWFCGRDLVGRFNGFVRGVKTARELICRQPLIHNFIAGSIRDPGARRAINDKFRLEEFPEETVVHYVSPNGLCIFYKGLAQWVADHFRERVEITEPRCLKRGDPECEIHVKYLGPREGSPA